MAEGLPNPVSDRGGCTSLMVAPSYLLLLTYHIHIYILTFYLLYNQFLKIDLAISVLVRRVCVSVLRVDDTDTRNTHKTGHVSCCTSILKFVK